MASGMGSVSMGNESMASGMNSIAIGNGTIGISVSVDSLATRAEFTDLRRMYNDHDDRLDEAEDGIALALSMETPMIPSGKQYAMTMGTGYYNSSNAISAAFAGHINDSMSFSTGAGFGTDTGKFGARCGMTFAW